MVFILDLPNDAKCLAFSEKIAFLWNLHFRSASERFLVLGRFGALGPPITVLTKI